MHMPVLKILLISTDKDFSLELFCSPESSRLLEPYVVKYNTTVTELSKILNKPFDYIYFRDPFNDSTISGEIAHKTTQWVLEKYKDAYSVDKIGSYQDMLFEDKWRQYQLISDFMPPTEILTPFDLENPDGKIIKKRISSRSRDIIFETDKFPENGQLDDYIIQPKLDIEVEYRVFMIGGEIIKPILVKSSKTSSQKVKVIGTEEQVADEVEKIAQAVQAATNYDFIGLDIVKTAEGYFLLEVNRSCQFKGFYREASLNLATRLNSYLLSRINN